MPQEFEPKNPAEKAAQPKQPDEDLLTPFLGKPLSEILFLKPKQAGDPVGVIEIPRLPELESKTDIFKSPPPGMAAFANFIREKETSKKPWSEQDIIYGQTKLTYLQDRVKEQLKALPDNGYAPAIQEDIDAYKEFLRPPYDLSDNGIKRSIGLTDSQSLLIDTYRHMQDHFSLVMTSPGNNNSFAKIKQQVESGKPLLDLKEDITNLRNYFFRHAERNQQKIKRLNEKLAGSPENREDKDELATLKTKEGMQTYKQALETYTPQLAQLSAKFDELAKPDLSPAQSKALITEIESLGKNNHQRASDDVEKDKALPPKYRLNSIRAPRLNLRELSEIQNQPESQRLAFVQERIEQLESRFGKAEDAKEQKEPLEQKEEAINGRHIPKIPDFIQYLKEAYTVEAQQLAQAGNRITRQEPQPGDHVRWPDDTLVGAAISQYTNALGDEYFRELTSVLPKVKTIPEAIKLIDFKTAKYNEVMRRYSSTGSNDSWNVDQPRKRMVLCLAGLDDPGQVRGDAKSHRRDIADFLVPLRRFGTMLDADKMTAQYKEALNGKYPNELKDKSVISVRTIDQVPDEKQWLVRFNDALADMKEFKKNNPDAEFMIVIMAHGNAQTEVPTDQVAKGLHREGGGIGRMLHMTENPFKKAVGEALGNSLKVVITGQCRGASIIE